MKLFTIPTAIERFNAAKELFASVDASYGLDKSQRELDLILSRVK